MKLWECTGIWRTAVNSARSSSPFEPMTHAVVTRHSILGDLKPFFRSGTKAYVDYPAHENNRMRQTNDL
jgi:hypothetical protein